MDKDLIYQNLINPKFDMSVMNWDTRVGLAAGLVQSHELYQKVLGRLASSLPRDKSGKGSKNNLRNFAQEIEDTGGKKIPLNSLRVYRRVYETLESIIEKIPEDWSYRAWRSLSETDNPPESLDAAVKDGLSSAEFVRAVRISKGYNDGPKENLVCNRCSSQNPKSDVCLVCGSLL